MRPQAAGVTRTEYNIRSLRAGRAFTERHERY
jgi:hypothetical protein